MDVLPVILEGETVRLEPLRFNHAAGLAEHAAPELFSFFAGLHPKESTHQACLEYIRARMVDPSLSFAIVHKATELAVGHTSYMDIKPEHLTLEIGSTWIGKAYQGTKVNPECKFLLLQHAFEELRCVRVQLKTDERNVQSQKAMEKLGAKYEGLLRKQSIYPNGYIRNTVMYSILDEEWPDVKNRLIERLSR